MGADGTWNVTLDSPMGQMAITLILKTDGDTLTGSMQSERGNMEINGGKVDGDDLSWTAELTQPMQMTLEYTAKVAGDDISGEAKLGTFGTAPFKGTRAA